MKNKLRSFKVKLWLYFVLFTALIFSVLWILQTVFFQSFYDDMLKSRTRAAAEKIIENSASENISEIIDELSLTNSALVYITDSDGNIVYSSDQFKGISEKAHIKQMNGKRSSDSDQSFGRHGEESGRKYRLLPEDYESFLDDLEASENGVYEISTEDSYVYGTYIDYGTDGEKYVLYISTVTQAMGGAVEIIRIQLLWGTLISIASGFVLAWFIARSFSAPVASLTEKAEHIAEDETEDRFKRGFCSELDELNDVLDETAVRLRESRDFQRELLANVSHDLRTPLTMIKGYAEMVRDISRTDEQQCSEDIGVIVREADRLTAMVNEILEYSEMQSAGKVREPEEVDFSGLVKRVCNNFSSLYARENGRIETDITENITVNGNIGRLERAVYNLLDNAVRHNGDSKVINVSLKVKNSIAELRITDHGNGIPEEELQNIWDRYYTYRQRDKKGVSGLGLAIVRQIVQMHSGTCSVESKQGEGSTFIIELKAGNSYNVQCAMYNVQCTIVIILIRFAVLFL